ncbi:hypothetical protein B0H10DRAFT_1966907 [Mycena sp. CBHHK59/15]|nr:hypothetical protein B0H10DRAFT_1966907 [Mycena sp. CBHHK59/15]
MPKIGRVIGFVKKLTLPSDARPDDSDPEHEHSVDSISGSQGQFRTQGTPGSSGDEDEAQEIPSVEIELNEQKRAQKGMPEQALVDPASNKVSQDSKDNDEEYMENDRANLSRMPKIGRVIGFVKKLTLPSDARPDDSDPEHEHSVDSISGSQGQFRTQGTPGSSGDEDEAQEIPHRRNTPKSKARLKGKSKKQPKIPPKEWCEGKRRGEGYKWIPAPAACNVIRTTPGQAKQIRDTGDYNTSWYAPGRTNRYSAKLCT